jgi:MYXO-CTERM domain-containing protein
MGSCDPCTGDPPDETDLATLGFEAGDHHHKSEFFFSRLHMRYAPEEATQDLVLYTSNITSSEQVRYIQYEYYLEDRFEICGEGWAEDPGSCDDVDDGGSDGDGDGDDGDTDLYGEGDGGEDTDDDGSDGTACKGCSASPAPLMGALWLLGIAALRRRIET